MESWLLLRMHLTCLIVFRKCDVLIRSFSAQILFYNFLRLAAFLDHEYAFLYQEYVFHFHTFYATLARCSKLQFTSIWILPNRELVMSISETDYFKMVTESIME